MPPFTYPKIPWYDRNTSFEPCIAFEKYDGTCLALHWNKQDGFQGVFTRRRKIEENDKDFEKAIPLFQQYQVDLEKKYNTIFKDSNDIISFAEFFGPNSFAGLHNSADSMQLIFFDIWTSSFGLLPPKFFIQYFKEFPIPKIIYQGKITGNFVNDLKNDKYGVIEGVVCKGNNWMCKIKTQSWLEKLKTSFKSNWTATDAISRDVKEELNDN